MSLPLLALGCGAAQERILVTADGPRPPFAAIDADPWALLPRGAVAWWRLQDEVFRSQLSELLLEFLSRTLPVSKAAQFQPEKDISLMVGSLYATAGSDFVAIYRGSFAHARFDEAFRHDPTTVAGKQLSVVQFAGATMYVSEHYGFSELSPQTIVTGTQLGVRRVLELVEERRMRRSLPVWFEELMEDSAAHFQVGVDLDAQPVPAVFRTDLEFMNHLRAARLVGNFDDPGLNFAGSLTFADPHSAEGAVAAVNDARKKLEQFEVLLKTLKIPDPIDKLEAAQTGQDAQIVARLDGAGVVGLVTRGQEIFGNLEVGRWLVN